jgi:hypothetical protein
MLLGVEFGRYEFGHLESTGLSLAPIYVVCRKIMSRDTNSKQQSRAPARIRFRHVKLGRRGEASSPRLDLLIQAP